MNAKGIVLTCIIAILISGYVAALVVWTSIT